MKLGNETGRKGEHHMRVESISEVESIIRSLDDHIAVTKTFRLDAVAQLLSMAKLELQMAVHRISATEFREFCMAVESALEAAAKPAEPKCATLSNLDQRRSARKRHRGC
jgi:hypothetical protein